MKESPQRSVEDAVRRRRAEARLREQHERRGAKAGAPQTEADTRRLVHELEVHQVELEMQNAELQDARNRSEALLAKYTDLYDFAPVGYFSVDEAGQILEINLTGAHMLGVVRSQVVGQRLQRFVASTSQPPLLTFLRALFEDPREQVCETRLQKADGSCFWANVHAAAAAPNTGRGQACRLAISDITALKQAEKAQQQLDALAAANRELRQEVGRRRAVEKALKQSHREQDRLLHQSARMQEQLKRLSHRLLQAQEEERRRISRELHDEITQTLVGINFHLESLDRKVAADPRELGLQINRTQQLVEKSVAILHDFARELRPPSLDDLGLNASLKSLLQEFMQRTGVRTQLTTFAAAERMDGTECTVLYRVVQSAIGNVAQHAQATRVTVSLRQCADVVQLEIVDNGKSFDQRQLENLGHNKCLGLLGMRERLEMIEGEFAIDSVPGQGTTIRAQIPWRHASPDQGAAQKGPQSG